MSSTSSSKDNSSMLDQLFLDCTELETLLTAMKANIAKLDQGVASGLVTTEHLLTLAFRIETAERGMIDIAHGIDGTATNIARRRERTRALH